MCAFGLPGWRYATTDDPDERTLLKLMLVGAVEAEEERAELQAVLTINALVKQVLNAKR
jgi:hypothetical protein